ncbi:MAG: membrane protein [Alphaproteobacteria bacterium]|nr:MAG: membrane protein [Alphaproteobacteria bacterium]
MSRRKTIRFGDYIQAMSIDSQKIPYQELMPEPLFDRHGNEHPQPVPKMKLGGGDILKILQPYLSTRFIDQARAVVPLAIYLALFQYLVLQTPVMDASIIAGGLFAVMIGLMMFMEGLKLGLMPFGEIIGNTLPRKLPLAGVLFIAFLLGIGVTFAEPAIGALQVAGSIVDPKQAPYLFTLLNDRSGATVLLVGLGVGLAAVLGTVRFLRGWSLKPMIFLSVVPTLILSVIAFMDPELTKIVGLAWDCGAVTTGPVTVPLVLALGIGVAAAAGKGADSSLSGFGIVTLASVFPILGVLILSFYTAYTVPPELIIEKAAEIKLAAQTATTQPQWYEVTPWTEVILGVRAIVPLVIFLAVVLLVILREKLKNAFITYYGIILAVVGMCIFNVGLTYGLAKLGDQSGGLIAGAFTSIDAITASPLYSMAVGVGIAALFAWVLGLSATLAEPALNALGMTVQNLTNGAFKKSMLMIAVAFGVATGIMLGVLKLIYGFHIMYILIPGYTLGLILTFLSTEEFVNVGWDSAGVTTGPVTVPLVLAMGLGFGNALGSTDGFGILAAASICPIVAVLTLGIYVQFKIKREERRVARELALEGETK